MFNLPEYLNVSVGGVPLVFIVIGLVTLCRKIPGMTGNRLLIASLIIGFSLGFGYQVATLPPVDFAGWFAAVIYGLAMSLVPSGLYDTGKYITGADKIINEVELSTLLSELMPLSDEKNQHV